MKKILTLSVMFIAISLLVSARQVDENTARTIGFNFITKVSGKLQYKTPGGLSVAYYGASLLPGAVSGSNIYPAFYVFNFTGNPGFVIVAGDDIVTPILGYSLEGNFSAANIAPSAAYWLKGYEEQIKSAVAQKLRAAPETESVWNEYLTAAKRPDHPVKSGKAVNPLIKLYWNQSPYYNNKCPKNDSAHELTITGCAATAMAMVMKYHNYPEVGTGYYSYKTKQYGTLSANFGDARYAWDIMPDSLTSNSPSNVVDAVATLMYHCGVSAEMTYGISAVGGSSASVVAENDQPCVANALKKYFGYDPSLRGLHRTSYTDAEWTDLIKEDLDASLPVLYTGYNPNKGGGHAFICDGYNDEGFFHFNWGWGGDDDGYFLINALQPGTFVFNCGQEMVKGVRPQPGHGKYFNLNLSAPVTFLSDVALYEDSISVMTGIYNNGQIDFIGSLGAAIFDTNEALIGFVEVIHPVTVWSKEKVEHLTFKNSGLPNILPGKYKIGIMYKSGGDDWMEVNDTLTYVNFPVMEVINPDVIEMASAMTALPAPTFTEGKAATVKLEIRNIGANDFSGTLNLAVHDMDGMFLTSLAQKPNFTLPAGSSSGQLTFSTDNIAVAAGSYMLALWYKEAGAEYELVGSTGFQNPVMVQVDASPLVADEYEPNNTEETASLLPVVFSGNTATLKLKNANCHVGTDVDVYKIEIPAGVSYTIHVRLENSEYDTTLSHPLNGLWNYSGPKDKEWQSPCNNSGPLEFVADSTGYAWFRVNTNFVAQTGMYQLNISITKSLLGIEGTSNDGDLVIYPNPARNEIFLNDLSGKMDINQCTITSIDGRTLLRTTPARQGDISRINVSGLSQGLYILRAITSSGTRSIKIIVEK